MNRYLHIIFALCLGVSAVFAQVSPYSLTPEWRFGAEGGLSFPTGSYPTSGAPSATPAASNPTAGVFPEASTSISSRSGAVAVYTNTVNAFNVNNISMRSFITDGVCSGSATSGGVAFPDPADPDNAYYVILGNDLTGGSCGPKGLNRYRFLKSAGVAAYNSGSVNMAANNSVSEALTVGTDGQGGYWIVGHVYTNSNTFKVWHVNSSGAISGPTDYTVGAATPDVNGNQAYTKISPCQDKVAYSGGGVLVVHSFNRATGVVGAELRRLGVSHGVGLEFSPDGSKVYYSGQGTTVGWVDIASGTTGTVGGSASWSMQLGPDGKIYTSPGNSALVGVISSPNASPTYSTITSNGFIYRGLSNIAWLSPQLPVITPAATATCNIYDFSFVFRNYFNSDIPVNLASVTWNWGDASPNTTGTLTPQHAFPTSGGPYTVTLTFTDQSCTHPWTASIPVTISCSAPVTLLSFAGLYNQGNVDLTWQTAMEVNNDFFELQRSTDGINFTTIANIDGAGNSSSVLGYDYTDVGLTGSIVYYRLLQHDYDGTITASQVISVRLNKTGAVPFIVAPNPFSSSFVLHKMYDEVATVSVYDALGRLREQKVSNEGEQTLILGENLSKGAYIIHYATTMNVYTFHVEKQ